MSDLTEKWKKGELPEGWYYKTSILGNITIADSSSLHKYRNRPDWEDIITILAPVPSFEEWVQLKKWCEEFNALDVAKENEKLKSKLQLKETAYDFDTARLEEENTKLKGLLKECVELMGDGTTYMHIDVYRQRKKDVMNAISQVLGED